MCSFWKMQKFKQLIIKRAIFDNPMGFEPILIGEEQEKYDTNI